MHYLKVFSATLGDLTGVRLKIRANSRVDNTAGIKIRLTVLKIGQLLSRLDRPGLGSRSAQHQGKYVPNPKLNITFDY